MAALDRDMAAAAAERLKVFAQPQRLMILSVLVGHERAVGAIDAATGIGQPALSQQLAELRRAGLVEQRREAKQVLYRLADDRIAAIVRFVSDVFGREGEPAATLKALQRPAPPVPAVQSAAVFAVVENR